MDCSCGSRWPLSQVPGRLRFQQSVSDAGSSQSLADSASKLLASDVNALELEAQSNPNDLKAQELLITYYTLKGVKPKRLEHALRLIRNHPEPVIDCPDARLSEQDSPLDSRAAFEEAKTLWLSCADSRTTDPRVLMSAAGFISQFDSNLSERLLLQGQQLDPEEVAINFQ